MESAQRDTVWFGGGGREKKKTSNRNLQLENPHPKKPF